MNEPTMRDAFFDELYGIAKEDRNIVLITADCGAPSLDKFRADLPEQFINVGIAEQNMISLAAGLALEGKRPFCYAITPFASLRCLEQIKVDLCCMGLPVTILAVGAGFSYDLSGPTHHALEDIAVIRSLPNMTILNPSESTMVRLFARAPASGPRYIRLERQRLPRLYEEGTGFEEGLKVAREGKDLTIVATGRMVHRALEVVEALEGYGLDAGVMDVYRLSPFPAELLLQSIAAGVVTLEENFAPGGLGSMVAEALADAGKAVPLKRLCVPHEYCFEYGGRSRLHTLTGLDLVSVSRRIMEWLEK